MYDSASIWSIIECLAARAEDSADWSVVAGWLTRLVAFGSPSSSRLAQSYSNRASDRVVCYPLSRFRGSVVCVCAYVSACHARRTTLYVPERCASDALTDTKRESESTDDCLNCCDLQAPQFLIVAFSAALRSRQNQSGVPQFTPIRCSIINYSSERVQND